MIYFLEDWRLAEELRDNRVPEFEKFIYFLLLTLWTLISGSSTFIEWSYQEPTHTEHLLDGYIFIVNVVGLWTCYDRNKEGDHKDFITRITCLSFPASVRMLFLACLIFIPVKVADNYFNLGIKNDVLLAAVNLVIFPYFYHRLYKTISIAAFPAHSEKR